MKILTQGSTNAIGDFFVSTHLMYHFHTQGHEVSVALKEDASPLIVELYKRTNFFKSILTLSEEDWNRFSDYSTEQGYHPHLYLCSVGIEKGVTLHPLWEWFDLTGCDGTFEGKYAIIHVTSSSNYTRPKVPHLDRWLEHILEAELIPVFIGGEKDTQIFKDQYPQVYNSYSTAESWRIGKDSLWQSIGNILHCDMVLTFSSWSSIVSSLMGKYTVEMWSHNQVLFYGAVIRYYLGSPINLIQVPFTYKPELNAFNSNAKKEMDLRTRTWYL